MVRGVGQAGDAEIGDLHVVTRLDHDVGGLDVAMDDAMAVGEVERLRDLRSQGGRAVHRQSPRRVQLAVQAHAVDELHGQVAHPIELADVVDGHDVGVLEPGGDHGFALEAVHEIGLAEPGRGQALQADGLDRDHAVQRAVPGLVDRAERPGTQRLHDLVTPGDLVRHAHGGPRAHAPSSLFNMGNAA